MSLDEPQDLVREASDVPTAVTPFRARSSLPGILRHGRRSGVHLLGRPDHLRYQVRIGRFRGSGDGDQAAEIDSKVTASDRGFDAPFGDDQGLDWIVGTLLAAKIHLHVESLGIEQPARGINRIVESRGGRCRCRRARRGRDGCRGNTGTRRRTRGLGGRRRGCGGARTWLSRSRHASGRDEDEQCQAGGRGRSPDHEADDATQVNFAMGGRR